MLLILPLLFAMLCANDENPIESTISSQHAAKKIISMTCVCTDDNQLVVDLMQQLKMGVEITGQMTLHIKQGKQPSTKSDIKTDADDALCVLYISSTNDENPMVAWRLYDALDGTLLGGKKCALHTDGSTKEQIALWLWKQLFNYDGPFGSYIAYIAIDDTSFHNKYSLKYCFWNGSGEHHSLISTAQPIVCPAWNASQEAPGLVFSECTAHNVRLMMINLLGHQRIIIDKPGTFAGVSYAPRGEFIAYCRSGDIWHFKFDSKQMKSIHTMLVHEPVPTGCPQVTKDGNIIYCCKGKIKKYHVHDDWTEIITDDGYCVGPSYSVNEDSLVFSKRIKGTLQLVKLNLGDGKSKQLTTDDGNKMDPVWSPCGTMVAFIHQKNGIHELVILNVLTGKRLVIDTGSYKVCCPAWSTYRSVS